MKRKCSLLLFCLVTKMALCQVNLNQGLIAHYPFSGNANDASGNNNHGIVYGATLTSGLLGLPNSAYYFNGLSDYIEVADHATLTPVVISMCAVVKLESFYTGPCQGNVILWKGSNFDPGHYGLHLSDAVVNVDCNTADTLSETFYPEISGNGTGVLYSPFTTSNTWYCVVATYDGDSTKLYLNGSLKYAVYTPVPLGSNNDPLDFGHNIYNPLYPYWFNGVMDDIRIYDRVLSDAEVSAYCSLISGVEESRATPVFDLNNVAKGVYHLQLKENYNNISLVVYNYTGSKVTSENLKLTGAGTQHKIDLTRFSNGIYMLEIVADGKQMVKKLVN